MLEELQTRISQTENRYALLVDPLLGDPLRASGATDSKQCYPLPIDHPDMSECVSPYLIEVSDQDQILVERSCRIAAEQAVDRTGLTGHNICAWIEFRGDPVDLARALAQKVLIERDDKRVFFRYIDPQVMRHLDRILRPGQFRNGLIQVTHWQFVNARASLAEVSLAVDAETPAPVWLLRSAQWEAIDRIELVNALDATRDRWAKPAREFNDQDVDMLLLRAIDHGLTRRADQLAYARNALEFDLEWDRHPQIAACMRTTANVKNKTFVELLFDLPAQVWNELSSGAWKSH